MVGQNKLESRGRISTDDLLVLTSLDRLFLMVIKYINFNYKRIYLNEVVYCTKPSPSVGLPVESLASFFVLFQYLQIWQTKSLALPSNIRLPERACRGIGEKLTHFPPPSVTKEKTKTFDTRSGALSTKRPRPTTKSGST
jgi:hypothetical protein